MRQSREQDEDTTRQAHAGDGIFASESASAVTAATSHVTLFGFA